MRIVLETTNQLNGDRFFTEVNSKYLDEIKSRGILDRPTPRISNNAWTYFKIGGDAYGISLKNTDTGFTITICRVPDYANTMARRHFNYAELFNRKMFKGLSPKEFADVFFDEYGFLGVIE